MPNRSGAANAAYTFSAARTVKAEKPNPGKPDAGKPKAGKPKTGKPKTAKLKTAKLKAGKLKPKLKATKPRFADITPARRDAGAGGREPVPSGRAKGTELPEWDLSTLYAGIDSAEVASDLARADALAVGFEERFRGKLAAIVGGSSGPRSLADAIREFENLDDLIGRITAFAYLVYAGNMADSAYAKFHGDVQERITATSSHLLFFPLELNNLDDAVLQAAMADPVLGHYRPWLEDIRKDKPHQLEDRIEQLFHEKSITSQGAWTRLFDDTVATLRFKVDGKKLPIEPTLNLLTSRDAKARKAAAVALGKTFGQHLRTFTLITNTLAKDKEISDRWRSFSDIADARHLSNRVEREVVDALVAAVRDAYPAVSHRYYALKARWFGKKRLPYWDRNAPLAEVRSRLIPWDDARHTVLSAYGEFSPAMADIAAQFFTDRWIDAPPRPGKSPGAFSHPTVPSSHPFILLNYQGRPRDVMTLAHELGHGVHQVLAAGNGALMAPTPLTLAETASVFGEMLTFRRLLAATGNARERKALLAAKVEDMINTVMRQVAFYTFERAVHSERRNGELTAERIGEIFLQVQRESLGPAIEFKPGYETFWTYIGHFVHSPFYVYAYAFGDCLVNALYAVYENAHEGFAERYLAMLQAGGTKHYSELLQPFGLNARDPAFWRKGLGMIEGMVSELEELG